MDGDVRFFYTDHNRPVSFAFVSTTLVAFINEEKKKRGKHSIGLNEIGLIRGWR